MRLGATATALLCTLLGTLSVCGCEAGETRLEVNVDAVGDVRTRAVAVVLEGELEGEGFEIRAPEQLTAPPDVLGFPVLLEKRFGQGCGGRVAITVKALDAQETLLASLRLRVDLFVGGARRVEVTLGPATDAGSDARAVDATTKEAGLRDAGHDGPAADTPAGDAGRDAPHGDTVYREAGLVDARPDRSVDSRPDGRCCNLVCEAPSVCVFNPDGTMKCGCQSDQHCREHEKCDVVKSVCLCGGQVCLPNQRCDENGAACRCGQDGESCKRDAECCGGSCQQGKCKSVVSPCANGSRDGLETDVDCGGPSCPRCAKDKLCVMAADCESRVCRDGRCAEAVRELPGDSDTLLLLRFDGYLEGADRETPTAENGVAYQPGRVGESAYFGQDAYVKYPVRDPASTNVSILPKEGTIEFWVKSDWSGPGRTAPNNVNAFFEVGWDWDNGILLSVDPINVRFIVWGDNPLGGNGKVEAGVSASASDWMAGVWYHLAATWDCSSGSGCALALYRNGTLAMAAMTIVSLPSFSTDYFVLGTDIRESFDALSAFDEFRISSRARSATEILGNYSRAQ